MSQSSIALPIEKVNIFKSTCDLVSPWLDIVASIELTKVLLHQNLSLLQYKFLPRHSLYPKTEVGHAFR